MVPIGGGDGEEVAPGGEFCLERGLVQLSSLAHC